ncbi:MAG: ribosome maturation factor RimM [Desulfobacterales bacterium]|nr:ribosome maturation factor RimM [Desulfobacterales bacterium]
MKPENALLIARIVGAHGNRGVCRVASFAESLAIFEPGDRLFLESPPAPRPWLEILWVKPHSKGALMAFRDVADRDAAETLRGTALYIDKDRLPGLEEESFYWFELIGMEVYTPDGSYLGRLESVLPTGSNDVYVVRNADLETLVPALASVVKSVDTAQMRMEVVLPEGL